jgi:membrane protein
MASLKERLTAKVDRLRERYAWFDHSIRIVQHYGAVNGNAQAGAVTYFGFLSIFPILAIGFFVVGKVAKVYPDIRADVRVQINNLLPGVIGNGSGQIPLATIEHYANTVGLIGLLVLLYSGLGWLSAMRQALEVMFVLPRSENSNFLFGKIRDLVTLVLIGIVLLVSVALSSAVTGFSGAILGWVGIDENATLPGLLLSVLGHALAIAASTVLLLTMFKLLVVHSHLPRRALVSGAVLGAVGFEILKVVANLLLAQTQKSPAFQAFGVSLILLVWINYFSRLVMYAAAWAYTAPRAIGLRTAEAVIAPGAALAEQDASVETESASAQAARADRRGRSRPGLVVAGATAVAAVVAVVRRRSR